MTDKLLVERLRDAADSLRSKNGERDTPTSVLMREAADHIEELEAQIYDAEGAEDVQCPTMDGP